MKVSIFSTERERERESERERERETGDYISLTMTPLIYLCTPISRLSLVL